MANGTSVDCNCVCHYRTSSRPSCIHCAQRKVLIANPTLSKHAFCRIINAILVQDKQDNRFARAMEPFLDGHFVSTFSEAAIGEIVRALESCFAYPEAKTIQWWLWDTPDAGKHNGAHVGDGQGNWYQLKTAEDLYDWLTTGKTQYQVEAPKDTRP